MKKQLVLLAFAIILSLAFIIKQHYHGAMRHDSEPTIVTFLQDYIRINTMHPAPDYDKAISFLKKHAQADGFEYQEISLPSDKKVLVISSYGTDKNLTALALNHHMDVVPAHDNGDWIKPPFAGQIHDGKIIGRGTQDMKGIAAVHYFALKEFKRHNPKHRRTIHIFAVPEEEVGGFKGTKEFIQTEQFKNLNVGYVIDEGHASGDSKILDIKVAERKPIQIQVTSKGTLAHGSHLQADNAVHSIISFLHEITAIHKEQQKIAKTEQPGKLLSCNITSLTAGIRKENGHIALNMVPDTAQATIDIRVPPTCKKADIIAMLDNLIIKYPNMTYTILAQAHEEPEIENYFTQFYHTLAQAIEKNGLNTQPHFFEASSDLRFYQALGIQGLGLTPFAIEDNIHGVNESVPVFELMRGKDIFVQFLKDFCS